MVTQQNKRFIHMVTPLQLRSAWSKSKHTVSEIAQ